MIFNQETAIKTARFLLQIKAIKLQPSKPFTWASGWRSPIYCDNRKMLSYPQIRTYVRQELTNATIEKYGKPDVIAGVATGGIAPGVLVAQELGLPFVYVRPAAKGHGLQKAIEGDISAGQSVVVIEDLISTGNSSLSAVKSLRKEKCDVKGMAAVFSYGFDFSYDNFKKNKCPLVVMSDYEHLIQEALESKYINDSDYLLLQSWRGKPGEWNGD